MKRIHTLIASAVCLCTLAPLASAQQMAFTVDRSSDGADFDFESRAQRLRSSPLTPEEFETYLDILQLDEDMTGVARDMYEGFRTENAELSANYSEKMMTFMKEIQESGDHGKLMEMMPKIRADRQEATENLRDTFLEDFKLLLSDDQADRWPLVEQSRRRTRVQSTLNVAAADVDLVELAHNTLDSIPSAVTEKLESYARAVDRMLLDVIDLRDSREATFALSFDMDEERQEQLRELSEKQRDLSVSVRDLNDRTLRLIAAELDSASNNQLTSAFQLAGFPKVYKPSYTDSALRAALMMGSIDADQRAQLDALQTGHSVAVAKLNARWERAIRDNDEEEGVGMFFAGPGGATVEVVIQDSQFDGDDTKVTDLEKAHNARNERDEQTLAKLRSVLNETQLAELPEKPKPRDMFDPANLPNGANAVFISTIETDGGNVTTDLQIITPETEESDQND